MDKIIDSILRFIRGISKIVWLSILAIALLIGGGIALVGYINKDNSIKMSVKMVACRGRLGGGGNPASGGIARPKFH